MSVRAFLLAAIAAPLTASAAAQNAVHFYRYDLPTPSCAQDPFRGELNTTARISGRYYRVETDPEGRLVRSDAMREGRPTGGYTIRYAGRARNMAEWTLFRAGKPVNIQKCVRDGKGRMVRVEIRNPAGVLTEVQRLSPAYSPNSGGREGWIGYTPDGKIKQKETDFFNANGVLIMSQARFAGAPNLRQAMFDPETGLVQQRQLFDLATHKLLRTDKYTYNQNGERIRGDILDGKGISYGWMEYTAGLETKRAYERADGTAEAYHYEYDEHRLLAGATLSVNGKLICKFVYIRDKDGDMSRTEARGADGSLLASYPNREVREIARDGHDPSGGNRKSLRHGNWW
jgi:hypothetical protein